MQDWAEKIAAGDARALARAATAVENRRPESEALLRELFPLTGRATLIGITGAPGSGKSTLVDQLARELRSEGRTVGIVAVDPSSPYTGGAILGDRIRMQEHHADPGVFIRSMASRGSLGGLAAATTDIALLLDAAGKQEILIETVGVGQDEVEIARLADVTVVVLVPGMGDDVQALKAGIMEIADVFVINKADHPGADRLEREIRAALELVHRPGAWAPPVLRTVATEGQGIGEVLAAIRRFREAGLAGDRRAQLWALRLREMLRERLLEGFAPSELVEAAGEVASRRRDPYSIVSEWIGRIRGAPGQITIDHLGIAVRSVDEALRFYEGLLGMRVSARENVPQEKVNVAMLPAGGARIELLEPAGPDSVIARFLEKRGPGLHHVALRVPDLDAAIQRLEAVGARLLNQPRQGAGGRVYVFLHPASAGGVLLELVQDQEHST